MRKTLKIDSRPAYFDGQLLQAEDFIAEQRYHRQARHRHNLLLHDWGLVRGLELRRSGDTQLTVEPGSAVDARGREIEIRQPVVLDLAGLPAQTRLRVTLALRDDPAGEREHANRIDTRAVLDVSDEPAEEGALVLGGVQLDAAGKIDAARLDESGVRRARSRLLPGSVNVAALDDSLRRGWMALPFRGVALEKEADSTQELPPPFRLGVTEARAFSKLPNGEKNTRGAGGAMGIVVPFGAQRLLQFRIAGVENAAGLDVALIRGGFDAATNSHQRKELLKQTIKGAPYNQLFAIEDGLVDPAYQTLSIRLHGHGAISVSLMAFEFSY
ncbi:hypothetical protein [Pseudorhodoferax sp.]|uniref:hypothetical protein n=1 Tax=Pseudorhodoferax sp. TaxID=1993553 RepID=UPI002DD625BF|nr:hypothetical protein [Pseudorhodoferax sp.]